MHHSLRIITMKYLRIDIRQQDEQGFIMLGHNTFDFALSPTLRTFNAPPPAPPKKPLTRRIIRTLPATQTTTKYVFANPSDESDATLNPMLIPTLVTLVAASVIGAYMVGKSQ